MRNSLKHPLFWGHCNEMNMYWFVPNHCYIRYCGKYIQGISMHPKLLTHNVHKIKIEFLPQKCINPATFTNVNKTQPTTCTQPIQSDKRIKVVKLMQVRASNKFRYNSHEITWKNIHMSVFFTLSKVSLTLFKFTGLKRCGYAHASVCLV